MEKTLCLPWLSADEVLEVNSLKLCGKSVHDICSTLCQMSGTLTFVIIPAPSPAPATPAPGQAARFPRGGRLSGPAVMGIAVPVIKTEKEQFEMSPLRDTDIGYNLDLGERDTHKYLADTDTAAIKMEPDMDLDFCLNESLEGLMGSYPFENEADIKPDIKSHEKDFSPTTTATTTSTAPTRNIVSQQQQPTSVPTGELLLYDVVGGSAAAAWSGVILSLHQVSSQCWLVLAGGAGGGEVVTSRLQPPDLGCSRSCVWLPAPVLASSCCGRRDPRHR